MLGAEAVVHLWDNRTNHHTSTDDVQAETVGWEGERDVVGAEGAFQMSYFHENRHEYAERDMFESAAIADERVGQVNFLPVGCSCVVLGRMIYPS